MFEAKLKEAALLKKLVDALKDLVTEASFDCTSTGISLQAMDSAHVSLVVVLLRADNFEQYRCDKNVSLGINLAHMGKILKCASNTDTVTMKADDNGDSVTLIFESKNKVAKFELKLTDIECEHLGIPTQDYKAVVKMPAAEFQRICRDMTMLGDTVVISATKDGVRFAVSGEIGDADTLIKSNSDVDSEEGSTSVSLDEDVNLTFALKYLMFFTKATALSTQVTLSMSADVPLVTEYAIEEHGYIRFYLAPKIEDEE